MHGKVLSLSYHAIVIFGQLILFFKPHFPANVFQEIMGIIDALKKDAHDQNEQAILKSCIYYFLMLMGQARRLFIPPLK